MIRKIFQLLSTWQVSASGRAEPALLLLKRTIAVLAPAVWVIKNLNYVRVIAQTLKDDSK